METTPRIAFGSGLRPAKGVTGGPGRAIAWLAGFLATGAALAVAAVLAIFAAAAVAVIALVASVMVFLAGLALRARRGAVVRPANGVIEARKVGHAWVTYGWDRPSR